MTLTDDAMEFVPDPADAATDSKTRTGQPWKILIVDDEEEIHAVTRFVIEDLQFEGRSLQIFSARSGATAREILHREPDIALALVDVVMETQYSGLDLIRFIRNELGNQTIRLVLRTGQPGYAPEGQVIVDYDINDYKSKTELTGGKLTTTVISSLRAYARMSALKALTTSLEARAESQSVDLASSHTALSASADQLSLSASTLRQLGHIGDILTTGRPPLDIYQALERHLTELLPVNFFGIALLGTGGDRLDYVYQSQAGRQVPPASYPLDHPTALAVRAFAERRAVAHVSRSDSATTDSSLDLNSDPPSDTESAPSLRPAPPLRSAVFQPLVAHGESIGVIEIQSQRANAFQPSELEILHSIAAVAGIALANASIHDDAETARQRADEALTKLRKAQSQLVYSEERAVLGHLVASAAQEIHLPIKAVKSSGKSVAEALTHALTHMPKVFQALSADDSKLFLQLVQRANMPTEQPGERDAQALFREIAQRLDEAGVINARYQASILIQLNAQSQLASYLPLLRHPDSDLILDTAQSVAGIVSSADRIDAAVDHVAQIVSTLKSVMKGAYTGPDRRRFKRQ